jgi:hypothetical protein
MVGTQSKKKGAETELERVQPSRKRRFQIAEREQRLGIHVLREWISLLHGQTTL